MDKLKNTMLLSILLSLLFQISCESFHSNSTEINTKDTFKINNPVEQDKIDIDKSIVPGVKDLVDGTNETSPDHSIWNELLMKNVTPGGMVDYKTFNKKKERLEEYLDLLASNPVQSGWSDNEKLAYWINVYNAYTIKLILDHYPVNSIMDINNGKAWDLNWIELGSKTYSLNQIENEIIRPQFKEPRIHFAVNCAAKSCPPLANEAFTAENLESLLEKQTKSFINNHTFNKISARSVQVSKIFDWYGEDFDNTIAFLNKYSDQEIKSNAKVSFMEYDWSLNQQ